MTCKEQPQLILKPSHNDKKPTLSIKCEECKKELELILSEDFKLNTNDSTLNLAVDLLSKRWFEEHIQENIETRSDLIRELLPSFMGFFR